MDKNSKFFELEALKFGYDVSATLKALEDPHRMPFFFKTEDIFIAYDIAPNKESFFKEFVRLTESNDMIYLFAEAIINWFKQVTRGDTYSVFVESQYGDIEFHVVYLQDDPEVCKIYSFGYDRLNRISNDTIEMYSSVVDQDYDEVINIVNDSSEAIINMIQSIPTGADKDNFSIRFRFKNIK